MTQAKPQPNAPDVFNLAAMAANLAESKKASDIVVLDTGTVSYLADYFVICSGDSPAQIRAIVDEIDRAFKQCGQERLGSNKDKSNTWALLDYGDIVIHVLHRNERQFYKLENFWNHATVISEDRWLNNDQAMAS